MQRHPWWDPRVVTKSEPWRPPRLSLIRTPSQLWDNVWITLFHACRPRTPHPNPDTINYGNYILSEDV